MGEKRSEKKDTLKSFGKEIDTVEDVVSFTSEIFYGGDILPGIALSTIARLRKFASSGYYDDFLKRFNAKKTQKQRNEMAVELIMHFFRIEAKYPVKLELKFINDQYYFVPIASSDERSMLDRRVLLDNPDGDRRYTEDLEINEEEYKDASIEEKLRDMEGELSCARRLAVRISSSEHDEARDKLERQYNALKKLKQKREERRLAIEDLLDCVDKSVQEKVKGILYQMDHNILILLHQYFLDLLERGLVKLDNLIALSDEKLEVLSDSYFLDLIEFEVLAFEALNELTVDELIQLKAFDIYTAITDRAYDFEEIVVNLRSNFERLYCMCAADLDDTFLERAPEVSEELMQVAEELDHEFDWGFILESLGETDKILLESNLSDYHEKSMDKKPDAAFKLRRS